MQNLRKQIAERFTEERERLRFSQSDLANKLGVSREGLRKNEIGATALNADTLAIAVELGFDIQYVLSGIRSKNLGDVEKEVGAHVHIQSGGSGNVVQHAQAGSTINMVSTQKHITRTTVKTDPDGTHISVAQQAKIQRLVDDIVELESRVKKNVVIANAYSQYNYGWLNPLDSNGRQTDYDALRKSLTAIRDDFTGRSTHPVIFYIPKFIGQSLAKGDPEIIQPMVKEIFKDHETYLFYI